MSRMNWLMFPAWAAIAAAMLGTMGASASDRLVQQEYSNSVFNTPSPILNIELTEYIVPSEPDDITDNSLPDFLKEANPVNSASFLSKEVDLESHRISKAAEIASKSARAKSIGKCAMYVRKALQAAGYEFTPLKSAYMYNNGTLANIGFVKVNQANYQPQVGDVVVFNRSAKNPHGHIQIFDGNRWVSDFKQPKFSPYTVHNGYTVWRDAQVDASNTKGVMLAMNTTD